MPQDNEKIKRVIKKVVDNSQNLPLAILHDTTDIQESLDELGNKIAEPKDVNLNIEGAAKVIIRGKDGIDGENGKDGEKGEKGDKGDDGYTPIKGVDYFDGIDGKDGRDGIDGLDGKDGKDGIDGKDGSPDTREQIIEKINSGGESKIDFSQIYGFDFPTRTEVQTELARITSMRGGIGQIEAFNSTGKIGSGSALKFIGSGVNSVTSDGHTVTVNITGGAVDSVNGQTGVVVLDTGDITEATDKNYVTDAQLTVLGNTSGTNTGDNATNTQYSGLATSKQDTLVSGTNIKTVNGTSILGSGDVAINNETKLTGRGLVSETYDQMLSSSSSVAVSQRIYFVLLPLKKGDTVTNISIGTTTASTGATTNAYLALYDTSGNRLAVSSDQTTGLDSVGMHTVAMGTPYSVTTTGVYYVAVLVNNGGTPPTFGRNNSNSTMLEKIGSGAYPAGLQSSQTSMPTTATISGGVGNAVIAYWMGVS